MKHAENIVPQQLHDKMILPEVDGRGETKYGRYSKWQRRSHECRAEKRFINLYICINKAR